ncbi:MAG: hypothetical protein OEY86_20890 [Nitrospira sp.]|nr:hypothetical protein [Nitrospira sp.]
MTFATRILSLLSRLILTRKLFWFWILIFSLAPIFPLSNFVGHPHWDNIRWIPFQDVLFSPTRILIDIMANVMWFIPLGAILRCRLTDHFALPHTMTMMIIASGISLSI